MKYSWNILKCEYLGYLEIHCFFERSAMKYFWAIHGRRFMFMLVAFVPTYCVTWDNS
jgi:hypothetical protein